VGRFGEGLRSKGCALAGFGERVEDRGQVHVVGACRGRLRGFFGAVRRDPDGSGAFGELRQGFARASERRGVEAEMDADPYAAATFVCESECNVDAAVHDQGTGLGALPCSFIRRGPQFARHLEERAGFERTISQLDPVDPGGDGSAHRLGTTGRRVGDEAKDGAACAVAQNWANPSRGLEAEA